MMKWLERFLLAGLAVLAAFCAFTWEPDRPVSALAARWAPPPSTFVDVAGLSVHLRDEGDSADPCPILLLHGTGASLHTWDGWVRRLSAEHRVIRCDLPGFGLTGPAVGGDYTYGAYSRFLVALLDQLGISRCTVVGNSFGGSLAWQLAITHPERVARLVLVDADAYPAPSPKMPIGFRVARIPLLNRLVEKLLPRSIISSSVRNVYGDPSKVTDELIDRYFELILREGNRRAVVERFRQAGVSDLLTRIPEIQAPTLILWGGRDRLIPLEVGERLHREIVGSELRVFEQLGHVPHEEDPEITVAAFSSFLSAQGFGSIEEPSRR